MHFLVQLCFVFFLYSVSSLYYVPFRQSSSSGVLIQLSKEILLGEVFCHFFLGFLIRTCSFNYLLIPKFDWDLYPLIGIWEPESNNENWSPRNWLKSICFITLNFPASLDSFFQTWNFTISFNGKIGKFVIELFLKKSKLHTLLWHWWLLLF